MNDTAEFEVVIEPYRQALEAIITGDSGGYKAMYSPREDITLANPFGTIACGRSEVFQALDRAAANFADGELVGIETFAKLVTPELASLVQIERVTVKVAGAPEPTPVAIRVTSVFRREEGTWKLVHRHADPRTTPQAAATVFED